MKTKTDIYLEEWMIRKLEDESHRTGLSFSRLIEEALEKRYPILLKREVKDNGINN